MTKKCILNTSWYFYILNNFYKKVEMKGSGCTFRVPFTAPGSKGGLFYTFPPSIFKPLGSKCLVPAACSASPRSMQNHSCEWAGGVASPRTSGWKAAPGAELPVVLSPRLCCWSVGANFPTASQAEGLSYFPGTCMSAGAAFFFGKFLFPLHRQ